MTRRARTPSILTSAAALLVLGALLVCFYPRSALAVLSGGEGPAGPRELTVLTGGEPFVSSPDTEQALLAALADRACVRLPGLPYSPAAGDICLSYGDMCAFFSPGGAYLRAAGGGAPYFIMGSGPELYQRVQRLVSLRA